MFVATTLSTNVDAGDVIPVVTSIAVTTISANTTAGLLLSPVPIVLQPT